MTGPQTASEMIPLGAIPTFRATRERCQPFLTVEERTWTSSAFDARANRRARALEGQGVRQGDLVTVALPNGLEFYETTFALWKLGAVPNIVSSRLAIDEFAQIIVLANPRLVIGGPKLNGGPVRIEAGWRVPEDLSPDPLPDRIAPFWKAMTSGGSTGRPKVIVDHMAGVWPRGRTMLLQEGGGITLNAGPLYHNGPFSFTHFQLFSEGHTVERGRFDPEDILQSIERYRATYVPLVPTMMSRLIRLPDTTRLRYDLSSLRVLMHFASMCPHWLKRAFIDWLGAERIWELYAGTERQGLTLIRGDDWIRKPGSVGRVSPGYEMTVMREDGSQAAPGEVGEIYFLPPQGANSTYHYLGAASKQNGGFDSLGDLGWIDEEGFLFLADRRTDLIISGGANIYPAEVEAAIEAHPSVVSAVALGLPDQDLGQRVHAVVQIDDSISAADAEQGIRLRLETSLTRYKWPRSFEFVKDTLRDDAGKVRRSALREARIMANASAQDQKEN